MAEAGADVFPVRPKEAVRVESRRISRRTLVKAGVGAVAVAVFVRGALGITISENYLVPQ